MTRGPRAYYVDFVLLPISIGLITATQFTNTFEWWGLAAHGLVMFTMIEYLVHRFILHKVFWSNYHQRHHQHADEYVVFPWWYMPAIFIPAALLLPWAWTVGFQIGALWYFSWHHVIHHWDLRKPGVIRRWLLAYNRFHDLHHKDLPVNYGVTSPLWDYPFGTYCSTEDGRKLLMQRALKGQAR